MPVDWKNKDEVAGIKAFLDTLKLYAEMGGPGGSAALYALVNSKNLQEPYSELDLTKFKEIADMDYKS